MGSADGPPQETLRFLLLGKTGSGKSSTGNTILGQDLFDAEVSFVSVTDECQLKSATNHGVTLEVVDCPGMFDTGLSNAQVAQTILSTFSQLGGGTDVICYVIPIGGYTDEDYAAYRRLKVMLDEADERFTRHLAVIFTFGDRLKGLPFSNVLSTTSSACLHRVLEDCEHRYIVFNNNINESSEDSQYQVVKLIQIARRMKEQNQDRRYICPSYVSSSQQLLQAELATRFDRLEQSEAEQSVYVQRLKATVNQTEQSVRVQEKEFECRAQENERSFTEKETSLQRQISDLQARLNQHQVTNSSLSSQQRNLQSQLAEKQRQQQQVLQQLQANHAAVIQQKNAVIRNVR